MSGFARSRLLPLCLLLSLSLESVIQYHFLHLAVQSSSFESIVTLPKTLIPHRSMQRLSLKKKWFPSLVFHRALHNVMSYFENCTTGTEMYKSHIASEVFQKQGYSCSVGVLMFHVPICLPCVLEACQIEEEEHLFCWEVIATQKPLIARIFHWEQSPAPLSTYTHQQPDYKSTYWFDECKMFANNCSHTIC